jgi:hypothetical protein
MFFKSITSIQRVKLYLAKKGKKYYFLAVIIVSDHYKFLIIENHPETMIRIAQYIF